MEERIRRALAQAWGEEPAAQASLHCLGGHASLRIYWRIEMPASHKGPRPHESTYIAMVLPQERMQSDEASNGAAPKELPFVDVQRLLGSMRLPVGAIDILREDLGVLVLEDLGDTTFEELYLRIGRAFDPQGAIAPTEQLYHRAINLLIALQRAWESRTHAQAYSTKREAVAPDQVDSIVTTRRFDRELLGWELRHYVEWGLEAQHGPLSQQDQAAFGQVFDRITQELVALPQTLVLRDYQSRNLMDKRGALVLIDYQDALMGPVVYDLVALLRDSYIELPFDLVSRLVGHYITQGQAAGLPWCDDPAGVRRAFDLQTLQRKLKDAGRFIFIDRERGNPSFLEYYTPSMGYVRDALTSLEGSAPGEFSQLGELLERLDPDFTPSHT